MFFFCASLVHSYAGIIRIRYEGIISAANTRSTPWPTFCKPGAKVYKTLKITK